MSAARWANAVFSSDPAGGAWLELHKPDFAVPAFGICSKTALLMNDGDENQRIDFVLQSTLINRLYNSSGFSFLIYLLGPFFNFRFNQGANAVRMRGNRQLVRFCVNKQSWGAAKRTNKSQNCHCSF